MTLPESAFPKGKIGFGRNYQIISRFSIQENYINKDIPPIISIHGDSDWIVTYSQSVRLHEDLNNVGVMNKLITVENAKHGNFTEAQLEEVFPMIFEFLKAIDE